MTAPENGPAAVSRSGSDPFGSPANGEGTFLARRR